LFPGRAQPEEECSFDRIELGRKYPITLVEYDPDWPGLYEQEARWLRRRFPGVVLRTEHIGSTAVPGLVSKPVIDVLVEVSSFDVAEREITSALLRHGYKYMWSTAASDGHMVFVKGYGEEGYVDGVQRYHLHLAPAGHTIWGRVRFRDGLRRNPCVAERYAELKRRLATRHRHDREAYTEAKTDFILGVMGRLEEEVDQ
jgi:GrpB-like predicted nucleotidyltransferase (UPF0157 family)